MEELSTIQAFYKGKNIFITGGSGFMGKVLIEKLLYSCSNVENIYILLRTKRGLSVEQRLKNMFELPMFFRIKNSKPEVISKIVPVSGDITISNLGIPKKQRSLLEKEINIVFHCAATLKLESNLKDAVLMNTIGTRNVINLAKKFERIEAFVHLSTAFCHIDQNELCEKIYTVSDDPENIIKLVEHLDDNTADTITPKLIHPHPNTYTYSKRLAEKLIAEEFPNLPCVIVRPSIVTPAWSEPLPGWVDNLNGPVGLIVGAGKGVIRSMHCNPNFHAEVIPVDLAVNAILTIAFNIGMLTERLDSIPVYNITQSGLMPITWGEVLWKGKSVAYDYPFESAIWYPDGDIRSNKYIHYLFVIFFHIVPAYFIDLLMIILLQQRFMVRLQKKISNGLDLLQYFTTREWIFHNTNLLVMLEDMSEIDRLVFPIDVLDINELQYIKSIILGARQYCMKEKLSTLQKARKHQTLLYVIHNIFVYSFYFVAIYFIFKNLESADPLK